MKGCVGVEGIFLGFSSNGNVRGQQDKAEGQNQDQVDQKEQTASVLGAQIRKAPDVSEADGRARSRKDKANLAGKLPVLCQLRLMVENRRSSG